MKARYLVLSRGIEAEVDQQTARLGSDAGVLALCFTHTVKASEKAEGLRFVFHPTDPELWAAAMRQYHPGIKQKEN